MTRSDPQRSRAFVTFRVAGDDLVPDQVTKLLRLVPTQAYAKGETYTAGPRSGTLRGKTGVWYLSTDRLVASDRVTDHLVALLWLLLAGPHHPGIQLSPVWPTHLSQLKQLIERKSLRAVVTCFWNGSAGAKPPSIPRAFSNVIKLIPAEIELDFDTDEASPSAPRRIAVA